MQVNYREMKTYEIEVDDIPIGLLLFNEDGKIEKFEIYQQFLSDKTDFDMLKIALNTILSRGYGFA